MADLQTDVRYIKGIGEARAKALSKLGIGTLQDLIGYFPRRYEDRTMTRTIRELELGETVCVRAMIANDPVASRISGGRTVVKARAVDDSGALDLTFFNQEYRKNSLHRGETYIFCGKVEGNLLARRMINPIVEQEGQQVLTGHIVPIYPLTAGVSQNLLYKAVGQGLTACRHLLTDCLPDAVRQEHQLCHSGYAYENIHFPADAEALNLARRRMVFEELFILSCGLQMLRSRRTDVAGPACKAADMEEFYRALPFPLTKAQRRAITEAVTDMESGRPMNRLCQGDVGSGKTMVAAGCVWFAAQSGWQSALMAPTEILARQHYENLAPLFEKFGLRCALLTGSTKARDRRDILEDLALGGIDLCIGTHALLTEDVSYARLGLVITDEQHRFGVNQRAALGQKADNPHMLVLSATPIPRTLALIIYGDLDVSVMNELPPGRQKVDTFAVGESYRQRVNQLHPQAGGGGASGIHRMPAGGPGGPHPRRAQGRRSLRQKAAGGGIPGFAGVPAPREDEAQGKGKGHGGLCRRKRGHFGGHHGGGGGRGCAQRHLHGGGERRALRPFAAAPAPGPGGPGTGEKLLHFALGASVGGDKAATEGDDQDQRRL